MGFVIDTSILVDAERGRVELDDLLQRGESYVSVVTASELFQGGWRAKNDIWKAQRFAYVNRLVSRIPIIRIDLGVAKRHAELVADLASRGTPIGPNDGWIAATCVAHRLSLITTNVREFSRVPGLVIRPVPARS